MAGGNLRSTGCSEETQGRGEAARNGPLSCCRKSGLRGKGQHAKESGPENGGSVQSGSLDKEPAGHLGGLTSCGKN